MDALASVAARNKIYDVIVDNGSTLRRVVDKLGCNMLKVLL
jgi:hypothetical protein